MSKDEIVFGQVLLKYVCPCSQIDCGHKISSHVHSLSVFIILLQRYDFIFIYRAIPPAFLISIEENAGKIFGGNKNIAYLCS